MTIPRRWAETIKPVLLKAVDHVTHIVFFIGTLLSTLAAFATRIPSEDPTMWYPICAASVWLASGLWVVKRAQDMRRTMAAFWLGVGTSFVAVNLIVAYCQYCDHQARPRPLPSAEAQFRHVERALRSCENRAESE